MSKPRSAGQRKSDALAKLGAPGADAWVASASTSGAAHLVPLSIAWDGTNIILALESSAATSRNIAAAGRARLALGASRDVVMIDVEFVDQWPVVLAPPEIGECYANQADWDPRAEPGGLVYLSLRPARIQVWRQADEIKGRTIMRRGAWLV